VQIEAGVGAAATFVLSDLNGSYLVYFADALILRGVQ
jgi:hypothetical protein